MTSSRVLEQMAARLDRLEAENEQLRRQLPPRTDGDTDDEPCLASVTSRRTWLARGAAVAVGAVAGAAIMPRTASASMPSWAA